MEKEEMVAELEKKGNDLVKQVKGITDPLDLRLKQIEEAVKNGGSVDPLLKGEIANLSKSHEELTTSQKAFQKLVDEKLADLKSIRNTPERPETLESQIKSAMNLAKSGEQTIVQQIKAIKDGSMGKKELTMDLKAVGNMTTGTNLTGSMFTGPDLRPGIMVQPLYDPHLRYLFPQNTTEKSFIRYHRETAVQGGPDVTAEAATKPQMDFSFDEVDALVRKIAGYFRISEEMIDDIPYLLTYLTSRGMEMLKNVEDYEILHGPGTGQHLAGLDTVATAFSAGNITGLVAANEFDVLVAAKKQLRNAYMMPTGIIVNPDNYAKMRLAKATTGEYIFPVLPGTATISIDGTPIIENTRVTSDTFYVMDARWIEVVDRMQSQIRLYDQDQDNAIKNMVTCVIEERLALPIYRAECVVKGTFSDAIAAIG